MKIIKSYPDTFASFQKVNEVFGNFKRKVRLSAKTKKGEKDEKI